MALGKKDVIFRYNKKLKIMKTVEITIQDIWNASKKQIFRNKKKYTRKVKYKKFDNEK